MDLLYTTLSIKSAHFFDAFPSRTIPTVFQNSFKALPYFSSSKPSIFSLSSALSVATSVFSETPDILKNTERLAERNDIINNPKNYDKRYKNSAVLKQKPASEASSLQSGAVLGFAGVVSRASLGVGGVHLTLNSFNI